jgi:predicted component of type VI protein secretion system
VREALAARSDRDFIASAPARRGRSAASMPLWRRLLLRLFRRPGAALGSIIAVAAASAIAVNALGNQTASHPAPLFASKTERATAPRPADPSPAATPVPPSRPMAAAVPAPAPVVAPQPVPAPAPQAAPRSANRDALGDFLRGMDANGGAPVAAEPQKSIAGAQRALVKLGYGPLKVDGLLGQGTRQAIERFEKDRRLPVTGEITPRILRDLSAQAGLAIE